MPIEEDERSWFFMSLKGKVEKVAEIFREDVKNFPLPFQEWPPHPDVLYDQTIAIPFFSKRELILHGSCN